MDTFKEAARIMMERREVYVHPSRGNKHVFTGMLVCGKCGSTFRFRKTNSRDYWICNTFDSLGKGDCPSKKIPECRLIAAFNEEFGYAEFNEADFKSRVKKIIVKDKNVLTLQFFDGTEKDIVWKDGTRRDSWTPEMREIARQRAILQHKGGSANA